MNKKWFNIKCKNCHDIYHTESLEESLTRDVKIYLEELTKVKKERRKIIEAAEKRKAVAQEKKKFEFTEEPFLNK